MIEDGLRIDISTVRVSQWLKFRKNAKNKRHRICCEAGPLERSHPGCIGRPAAVNRFED